MKALKQSRQPSIFEWLFCGAMLALGVYLLVNNSPSALRESDLLAVEAVPSEAKMTTLRGSYGKRSDILEFKIGQYTAEYDSGDPHGKEVQSAVQSGRPIKAWFAKRHTPLGGDSFQLCKLSDGSREILSFSDIEQRNKEMYEHSDIVSYAIIGLGCFGLFVCWQQAQNFAASGARR